MKAIMYYAPKNIRLDEVSIPKIGKGELLVKIKAATTCGTDLKTYTRGYRIPPPYILGHEWAGDIVEVGEGITRFKEGMHVSGVNTAPCFECFYCKRGQYSLCEHLMEDGLGMLGTYAEYVRIPAKLARVNVFEIPEGVPYEYAALTEPLACVVQGVEDCDVQLGDTIVIVGGGGIGLFFLQLIKKRGAMKVLVVDLAEDRLRIAERLGADETINPSEENPVEVVKSLTEGRGADIVVEAVGKAETWDLALQLVRKGGKLNMFGGPPSEAKLSLDIHKFHYDSLRMLATFHLTPLTAKKAFDMIVTGDIDVKPIISRKMPLENVEKAFDLMIKGEVIRVALIP